MHKLIFSFLLTFLIGINGEGWMIEDTYPGNVCDINNSSSVSLPFQSRHGVILDECFGGLWYWKTANYSEEENKFYITEYENECFNNKVINVTEHTGCVYLQAENTSKFFYYSSSSPYTPSPPAGYFISTAKNISNPCNGIIIEVGIHRLNYCKNFNIEKRSYDECVSSELIAVIFDGDNCTGQAERITLSSSCFFQYACTSSSPSPSTSASPSTSSSPTSLPTSTSSSPSPSTSSPSSSSSPTNGFTPIGSAPVLLSSLSVLSICILAML